MAEPIYQHQLDGQEVEQEDLNLLGQAAGLADDRVLAELLRLVPGDGTNVAKAVLPFSQRLGDSATLVPNGATATARVLPFRAIIGSRSAVSTDPVAAWRDIRSAVYAQTTGNNSLGAAVAFAPNTSGQPRWDLVYVAFTPDANGASRTRYVRDPATGTISSPAVVTTKVQDISVMVVQGAPSATPAPPPPPADGGGTFYIPLAYVRIAIGFNATSTLVSGDILSIAPVVSLSRIAGATSLQPANQQFAVGGGSLTAQVVAAWGAGSANVAARPGFFLPPEMVGGESRIIAIDLTDTQNPSHGVLGVVDDTCDWRRRLFRWTCFACGVSQGNAQTLLAWRLGVWMANTQLRRVPNARAAGIGQDIQFGFGQSFAEDVNEPPLRGSFAMLVNPSNNAGLPSPLSQIPDTIGLMVDQNDGKLRVYTRASSNPHLALFVWLDATAPFPNWG